MTQVTLAGSAAIPEAQHTLPSTDQKAMDDAIAVLVAHKDGWLDVTIRDRIRLLDELSDSLMAHAEAWISVSLEAKGIRARTAAHGEEWLGGPVVTLRNMRLLARSLADIERAGTPQLFKPAYQNAFGRVVAPVFPTDKFDELVFQGFTGEIWMDPSVTLDNLSETQAATYKHRPSSGRVALVLGAGNVSSIGPMDALHKLFQENQVVLLKMNPVNEYLGPVLERALAPLIRRGVFRIVYGGGKEGEYLCQHPAIDEIHITGSDKTHDAIVFGVGAEGAKRKADKNPRNKKRITSELGNVSPIIIVPGPWSKSDLAFQGRNIASSLTNNAGFNCNATRVVVTQKAWSQREAFLGAIGAAFQQSEPRKPYYPGAQDRYETFLKRHPNALSFGPRGEGQLPWTMITDLDPAQKDELCFTTEAWCGVTSEVALPSSSVVDYIEKAVAFANDTLWGTLNCSIVVHPASLADPSVAKAVDKAIADLRFGSVAVNHWPALSYAFVSTTWGAYPGHTIYDVRSGIGTVHNTYMFEKPEKSVVRGPFKVFPKPAWFNDHKTSHAIGPKLMRLYREPSLDKIPGLLFEAIRG